MGKGRIFRANVALSDAANELAVIKIDGAAFPVAPLRSSSEVRKGSAVFTLGFPNTGIQGVESKITDGVISSLSGIGGQPNSFQISVPIQPGNSGGPLFDMTGAVVGVTSSKLNAIAMLERGGSLSENVNYAIKSNYLLELVSTDRNLNRKLEKAKNQKTLPLPILVEKAEDAIVFIVVTLNNPAGGGAKPEKESGGVSI